MCEYQALLWGEKHIKVTKNYITANKIAYFLQLCALNTPQQHLNSSASKYNAKNKNEKQKQQKQQKSLQSYNFIASASSSE